MASSINKHPAADLWGLSSSSSFPASVGLIYGWPMLVGCGSPSCLLHYQLACQVKYNGSVLCHKDREVQLLSVSTPRQTIHSSQLYKIITLPEDVWYGSLLWHWLKKFKYIFLTYKYIIVILLLWNNICFICYLIKVMGLDIITCIKSIKCTNKFYLSNMHSKHLSEHEIASSTGLRTSTEDQKWYLLCNRYVN